MENKEVSDMMQRLNQILGEDNIPENVKEVLHTLTSETSSHSDSTNLSPEMLSSLMNLLQSSNSQSNSHSQDTSEDSSIDMEMLLKLKALMEKMKGQKEDPRSTLLRSLKPYLNENRQSKVEQYIKLLNITKIIDVFNLTGGDSSNV